MQLVTHQVASCSTLSCPSNTASRTGRSRRDSINATISVASAGLRAATAGRVVGGEHADGKLMTNHRSGCRANTGIENVQETETATVDSKL